VIGDDDDDLFVWQNHLSVESRGCAYCVQRSLTSGSWLQSCQSFSWLSYTSSWLTFVVCMSTPRRQTASSLTTTL